MRIACFAILLLMISSQADAAEYFVSGRILNAETNEPVVFAYVSTHETNSSALSDENGKFVLRVNAIGDFHIHIEAFGYEAFAIHVTVSANGADMGDVLLRPSHIELKQIVVESEVLKSTYKQQSLDLNVLDKKQWMTGAHMTLSQQLTSIPGVNQLQTGQAISKPVIRGLSGNRIVVYDLGMKQEGQQWGSDHGLEIDAFTAEQVEVIKGPASLLYGSDALGGVIRMRLPSSPQKGWAASVSSQFRSVNDYWGNSVAIEGAGERWFVKARMTISDFADVKVPADRFIYLNRILPIENNRLKNTAGEELHTQTTVGYNWKRGVLKLTYSSFNQSNGMFPGIIGIPTGANVADDGDYRNVDLPRQEIQHEKLALNLTQNFESGWLQWDAGIQRNIRREMIRPHRDGYGPLPDNANAHLLELVTFQSNVIWHSNLRNGWKFLPGFSGTSQSNERSGWEFLLPAFRSQSVGSFIYVEKNVSEKSIWNGGLRYDFHVQNGNAFSTPIYALNEEIIGFNQRTNRLQRDYSNYSAALGWSYMFNERLNMKWNAARSFRVPNPAELLINGIHHGTYRHEQGDENLESEIGYQLDAALVYEMKSAYFKFTPFFNYFNNYIYLRPTANFSTLPDGGQVYRYTAHNAIFTGAELYMEWHPVEALHIEGSVDGVYSYNLETGLGLPFTPPIRSRWSLTYEKERANKRLASWSAGANYLVWSDQYNIDRNEYNTAGAYRIDLIAGLNWKIRGRETALRFAVNNLFDRYYFNHLSAFRALRIPEQGRNFSVSFHWPITIK